MRTATEAGLVCMRRRKLLEGRTPTTLADIYALGVMLYQVVVGDLEKALLSGLGAGCRG